MNYQRIWDPLYGKTTLSEFEGRLLALPEVQRLRYVRMCNINSLLITGASEVSRFEHTLGVLRLAQEWASQNELDKVRRNDLLAAAVLHDVQTGPFGHTFQYVLEDTGAGEQEFVHEDVASGAAQNYYMHIPEAAQFAGIKFGAPRLLKERWKEVSAIIDGSGTFGPIIAGTMDLDNLDNVVRLAYHSGLADRRDIDAVLAVTRGIKAGGMAGSLRAPRSILEEIARWQAVRKRLYEFLLLDWGEFSAKAMLTKAVERGVSAGLLGTSSWNYTDDGFLDHLGASSIGEYQDIADIVRRLRCGDLYWPMLLGRSNNVSVYPNLATLDAKEEIVQEIESTILRPLGMSTHCIFHLILDVGKTERAVKVDLGDGEVREIGTSSNALLVGVFLARPWSESPRQLSRAREKLVELLRDTGLGKMDPLSDPMGEEQSTVNHQLALF